MAGAGDRRLWSTSEVAERLGVRRETVYAYVSRGRLSRMTHPDRPGSWFDPSEVDRLRRTARRPTGAGGEVLEIETSITRIGDGRCSYRGRDVIELSQTHPYRAVAELLWTGELSIRPTQETDPDLAARWRRIVDDLPPGRRPLDEIRVIVAVMGAGDPFRLDLRPPAFVDGGRRLLHELVGWCDQRLATRAHDPAQRAVIDAAMVLLADHELAGSTFAARIAASFRGDVAAVVSAGLGPVSGARHGALSIAVEELLDDAATLGAPDALARWMTRGDDVPGLGHPLYPEGDPRGRELLRRVGEVADTSVVEELVEVAAARGMAPPNVDLGLGAAVRALDLVPGAGEAIFAVARTAGWIAHALEELERPSRLRPRARYVGP